MFLSSFKRIMPTSQTQVKVPKNLVVTIQKWYVDKSILGWPQLTYVTWLDVRDVLWSISKTTTCVVSFFSTHPFQSWSGLPMREVRQMVTLFLSILTKDFTTCISSSPHCCHQDLYKWGDALLPKKRSPSANDNIPILVMRS